MKIDATFGSIIFTGGMLDTQLQRNQFLVLPFGSAAKPVVVNEPWITYEVRFESDFLGDIVFYSQRLIEVRFLMDDIGSANEKWSETRELARKKTHDNWLASQLGPPPYKYDWGTILSDFDPRSGSNVIVRYAGFNQSPHNRA